MISAKPLILIKVTFLKHFALEVWVSIVNYCTIITWYKIVIDNCFCDGQSSKGNNSKSINDRVTILALCTSTLLVDTCIKFGEYSLSAFQVIERTRFVTDRQTDGRLGKNNMSPDPEGGRHNDA